MTNPTLYIFLNGSLGMDFGEAVSQAIHAKETLDAKISEQAEEFITEQYNASKQDPRTCIILEAQDSLHITNIAQYFDKNKLVYGLYFDESSRLTPTALALQYIEKDDPKTKMMLGEFELYEPTLSSKKWARETMEIMACINGNHRMDGGKWRELQSCVKGGL